MATDEELMTAVAAGDGRAFAVLCRRYERPLYAFLHRHTGGRDVEDLHQETWLRVASAARRFDPRQRFTTWLFQIAVNLARDWRRRPPPEPAPDTVVEAAAGGHDPTAASDRVLDARRLLAALPEPQRAAVILRYYHDLAEDEVAAILGIARGTVKSRLHYALARLVDIAAERGEVTTPSPAARPLATRRAAEAPAPPTTAAAPPVGTPAPPSHPQAADVDAASVPRRRDEGSS